MTHKEAIEKIKLWRALCNVDAAEKVQNTHLVVRTLDLAAVLDMAIETMERAEPLEPWPLAGEKTLHLMMPARIGGAVTLCGRCPRCQNRVWSDKPRTEYCSVCGQRIAWPEYGEVVCAVWNEWEV